MSSARKRAYKHKAYAEIDHLKQRLMMVEHHYSVTKNIAEGLAMKGDALIAENKALREALKEARMRFDNNELGHLSLCIDNALKEPA